MIFDLLDMLANLLRMLELMIMSAALGLVGLTLIFMGLYVWERWTSR